MPLILVQPEVVACCGENGCGALDELAYEALEPALRDGEVCGLVYRCGCGASMHAPRLSPDQAAATLIDPGVVWARRMWNRLRWSSERKLQTEHDLTRLPFASWPVPPGDHSLNLAVLWARLDAAGWPDLDERARRHEAALERWPVTSEEA